MKFNGNNEVSSIIFFQTFDLNDKGKKSALASVNKVKMFSSDLLTPRASVEVGTKRWKTVFETPAGCHEAQVKNSKVNIN